MVDAFQHALFWTAESAEDAERKSILGDPPHDERPISIRAATILFSTI
jgi:hypothetical protein